MRNSAPASWTKRSLGEIVTRLFNGGTPPTSVAAYWEGRTPWITGADFTPSGLSEFRRFVSDEAVQYTATNVIAKGELLLVTRTGVGKLAIAPCDVAISQDITGIYPDRLLVDVQFLYHRMRQGMEDLKKLNQGTSINGVVRNDLVSYTILLPPLPQQQRIAEILSTVDEAIEQTEALIAKTQQIKAGLMHDLFTRGVTADGQLRPPREEAPQLYKESPLGWIPKEWELHASRELCSVITKGTTPPAVAFITEDRTVRFLRVDNLTFDGRLDLSIPPLFVDPRVHRNGLRRSIIRLGDVLTNIVGPPLGKVAVVPAAEHEWNANQAIAIFRAVGVRAEYLKSWLLTARAQGWLAREAKQTSGQVNLTLKMCGDLPVPVPHPEEQTRVIGHLASVDESLTAEGLFLSKLRQQKSGLSKDLFAGHFDESTDRSTSAMELSANV